jgi:hypothetical protein
MRLSLLWESFVSYSLLYQYNGLMQGHLYGQMAKDTTTNSNELPLLLPEKWLALYAKN